VTSCGGNVIKIRVVNGEFIVFRYVAAMPFVECSVNSKFYLLPLFISTEIVDLITLNADHVTEFRFFYLGQGGYVFARVCLSVRVLPR